MKRPLGFWHMDANFDRVMMRDNVSIAPFNMDPTGIGNRSGGQHLAGALTQTGVSRTGALSGATTVVQGRAVRSPGRRCRHADPRHVRF